MPDKTHLAKLREGVVAWNQWRFKNTDISPNLVGADLSGLALQNANLTYANLRDADLIDTDFREADLTGAKLQRCNLTRSDLRGADLFQANLTKADLSYTLLVTTKMWSAKLSGAQLVGARLFRADISHADLRGVNMVGADLSEANLLAANLDGANLIDVNLSGASLIGASLKEATLDGCRIYGTNIWDIDAEGAIQTRLCITPPSEPSILIDDLEVAQFLYLMLHNSKIRKVIDTVTSKVVLILGRFTEPRKQVLDAIREGLRVHGYVPVLFDFDGPDSKSTTETVALLARMARFVIADLTEPGSVPWELAKIVPDARVPVQPLLLEGASTFSMAKDLWVDHSELMLPLCRYSTQGELIAALNEQIIASAEARVEELRRRSVRHVNEL
jgi:uncharacterized protein YjbI with pentapeptide repeats